MSEEPDLLVSADEGDDRAESEEIETPGYGPPEEVSLAVAAVEKGAETDEGQNYGRLEERGIQLRAGA